jgi:transposase
MKLKELRELRLFDSKTRTKRAFLMANQLADIVQQKIGKQKHGIERAELVRVICGIIYRTRTGLPWRMLPKIFGPKSTIHGWFMRCVKLKVFSETFDAMVKKLLKNKRTASFHLLIDGSLVLHPSRSELAKVTPRNHNKKSANRMILSNKQRIPLVLLVAGGSDNDSPYYLPLLEKLQSLGFNKKFRSHADKGFDSLQNRLGTTKLGGFPSIPVRNTGYAKHVPVPKHKDKIRIKVEHGLAALNVFRACQIMRDHSQATAQATLDIAGLCLQSFFAQIQIIKSVAAS